MQSHLLERGQLISATPLKETESPFPRSHQLSTALPLLCWTEFRQANTTAQSSWVNWLCHVQKTLFPSGPSWPLCFAIFLKSLFHNGPETWGCDVNVPFVTKHSIDIYSLLDQLWVFCINFSPLHIHIQIVVDVGIILGGLCMLKSLFLWPCKATINPQQAANHWKKDEQTSFSNDFLGR